MATPSHAFVDLPQFSSTPFADYYDQHILPEVAKMEAMRKGVLKRFWIQLAIGLTLLLFPLWVFVFNSLIELGILLILIPVVGIFVIVHGAYRWKGKVKGSAPYMKIFKFFGKDYKYDPDGGMDPDKLREHFHLLPDWDRHSESDQVSGSFNGCRLKLCMMHLEEKHEDEDSDGNKSTHYTTIFDGLCVLMQLKQSTPAHIVVRDKLLSFSFKNGRGKDTIKLEDPVFNKTFKTYATDQVEARVFITPAFMERLLAVRGRKHIKNLSFAVRGDKLLMLIEDRNAAMFGHSSLFKEMTFVEECNNVLGSMGMVFDIIDSLNLDDRVVA